MKGILIKDFYTLRKTLGLYVLMTVILSIGSSEKMSFFALFYATMLPVNLIAFDERSRFEQMQAMMPLSGFSCVLDKYLVGFAGMLFAALIGGGRALIAGEGAAFMQGIGLALTLCLLVQAVLVPLVLRFGVVRGRMIYVFALIMLAALLGGLGYMLGDVLVNTAFLGAAGLALTLALNVLSLFVARRVYMRRLMA